MNIDAELEAFIPLFPKDDLTDPITARKTLAGLAAAAPAPDTADMKIRMCRSGSTARTRRRAPSSGCTAADSSWAIWTPSTRWAARLADGSGAVVVSVGYRRAPEHRFRPPSTTPTPP